jgi:hypothetical protein
LTDTPQPHPPVAGLTETLLALTEGADTPDPLTLAQIVARLDDQARGVLMILFALPNCVPGIPGTSAITGFPLVFLTLQMAFNRPPWLPGFVARRSVSRQFLADVTARAAPWLRRIEVFIRPRLTVLTSDTAERLVGALGVVLSLTIMLPIPFGNTLPAVSLIVFSMAFIGRDGVWILAGIFMVGMSAALLFLAGSAALFAMLHLWATWFGIPA